MGATNALALPFPELTETADGPDAFKELADAVEDYFYDRVLPAGITRRPVYFWGSGSTPPTASPALFEGDTYAHTGWGALLAWSGTAWRNTGIALGAATAPKARSMLRQATPQTGLAAGSWVNLTFTAEDLETHGGHDNSTDPHRWTCPVGQAGLYMVGANATFAAVTAESNINCRIVKNGTALPTGTGASGNMGGPAGAGAATGIKLVTLAEGDWVGAQGYCSAAWGTAVFSDNASSLTVIRLD